MGKHKKISIKAACAVATLCATSGVMASPLCDETTVGDGCIELTGGKGIFTLNASYDIETGAYTGSLQYADTAANFQVSSSTVVDYTYMGENVRGFIFAANAENYNEVRVFIADNGDAGDQFQIQLLQYGELFYDVSGPLSASCADGGIEVECGGTPPPPPPPPPPQPEPEKPKPQHPPKPDHPDKPGKNKPKGNNGVGNGEDPQPPGNPPINDGPGTGPGNPGNRGGANK